MEQLPSEFIAVLAIVLIVGMPCLLIAAWQLRKRHTLRREAEAMKRGNKIYGDWRRDTNRLPLD